MSRRKYLFLSTLVVLALLSKIGRTIVRAFQSDKDQNAVQSAPKRDAQPLAGDVATQADDEPEETNLFDDDDIKEPVESVPDALKSEPTP